jgi:hypothetical protein
LKFAELETKIDQYMLINDRGVFRLLMAFMIARKLPTEPPFLFLIGSSSGGKTKLIQLFSKVAGYTEMGDLTTNTFLSGSKRNDKETSLLHTLTPVSFLVFKDWTTILSKYKEQMGALMGQLREIYDGSFNKRTGHGDNLQWKGKVSLLAGVTTAMYVHQKDMADMGERMLYYHLRQPDSLELGRWLMRKENRKRDEKALEDELQTLIANFESTRRIPATTSELPDFDEQTEKELIEIAYLATGARSSIERKIYDRNERMTMAHDREQIGRFLKQLRVLAYGLSLINEDGVLTPQDKTILYRIGLDSIPLQRKWVLDALTEKKLGGTAAQLADYLKYPLDSVKMWVEDLVALGLVENNTVYYRGGSQKTYHIDPEYARIISKFEHITPSEEALPPSEQDKAEESAFAAPANLEPPPENQREIFM